MVCDFKEWRGKYETYDSVLRQRDAWDVYIQLDHGFPGRFYYKLLTQRLAGRNPDENVFKIES